MIKIHILKKIVEDRKKSEFKKIFVSSRTRKSPASPSYPVSEEEWNKSSGIREMGRVVVKLMNEECHF